MTTSELFTHINDLNVSEKIILVEDIWDSIAQSNDVLPLPEWQKSELEKRYTAYKTGVLSLHDWKSVHSTLREKE